jgi:hypothetical protein
VRLIVKDQVTASRWLLAAEAAAGRAAPDAIAALYREAFSQFGAMALWNRRPSDHPTIAQALVVAESLRREATCSSARSR